MTHVYLTASEQKIYDQLSESLRNGWQLEKETLTAEDSPARLRMRMHLLRLHDPKLKSFIEKANAVDSTEALVELLTDTSFKDVAENDLEELFFALGPNLLTPFIEGQLGAVKTDDDMEGVVALTVIRHSLLESMQK